MNSEVRIDLGEDQFSRIFERHGRILIGRYCVMSDGEPFFLEMGVTEASFHLFGNMPKLRDLLNNLVNGLTISIAIILIIFVGSSSGPVDLLTFKEFRIF